MRNPPTFAASLAAYQQHTAFAEARRAGRDWLTRRLISTSAHVPLAPGWHVRRGEIVHAPQCECGEGRHDRSDCPMFGRVFRPDGTRVGFKGGDSGAYSVRPNAIKALSPEGRAWFKATLRNVRESERRSVRAIPTLAQLSDVVRERAHRLTAWASGGPDWRALNAARRAS